MPDAITPVGTQVKVDPMQGINMLSGMLGLQQQQQQLQTGKYLQQSAHAAATSNTQNTKEKMNLAQILEDPIGHGILDENGQVTPGAQGIVMQAAPTTGAEHYEKIVSAAKSKIEFNTSVNNLNASERAEVANATRPGLADPNAKPADITASLDALMEAKKGTPAEADYQKIVNTYKHILTNTASRPSAQISPPGQENWRQAGQRLALGLDPGGAVPQVGTGASGEQVARTNVFGTSQQRVGGYNPNTPAVAGATALNVGASEGDISRSNEVSAKSQAASATVRQSRQVDELADAISSGDISRLVSRGAQYAGITSISQARTQLRKDLGQLRGAVASRAGSDARASEILEGYPDDSTPTQTIHAAMDYIRGSARQDLARADLLQRNGRAGFQMADTALTSKTDPLMHEFMALKPEERAGFYRRNFKNAQEAQSFKDSVTAHQKRTQLGVQNGP